MIILPAIDLRNQKCVRLTKGEFSSEKIYNEDPIRQAEIFYENGLKFLHMVDLDGALAGELKNLNIIKSIILKFNFKVQVGGGVRNEENIKRLVDIGVDKIILGTAAIKDNNFLRKSCSNYSNKIALALDVRSNKIAISGWKDQTDLDVFDYLEKVKDYGISRVIYTDINKDGTRGDNELVLCELEDVNGEYIWLIPKRSDSEWDAGVGKSTIVSITKKYRKLLNKVCVYAVTYYKDTFHTKTKCE